MITGWHWSGKEWEALAEEETTLACSRQLHAEARGSKYQRSCHFMLIGNGSTPETVLATFARPYGGKDWRLP